MNPIALDSYDFASLPTTPSMLIMPNMKMTEASQSPITTHGDVDIDIVANETPAIE